MKNNEGFYAIIITVLILAAFIVPFTVLRDIEKWYGSFLFWIMITLIGIGINYFLIRNWGKEE